MDAAAVLQAPWDVGGGGVLGLINLADCGRNPPVTKIKGHTGSIQDLGFSPFYESILASGSEGGSTRATKSSAHPRYLFVLSGLRHSEVSALPWCNKFWVFVGSYSAHNALQTMKGT